MIFVLRVDIVSVESRFEVCSAVGIYVYNWYTRMYANHGLGQFFHDIHSFISFCLTLRPSFYQLKPINYLLRLLTCPRGIEIEYMNMNMPVCQSVKIIFLIEWINVVFGKGVGRPGMRQEIRENKHEK